ncbi:rhodanese-like domain-containing protein [Hydrogenophaga sp. BPS33]|uniref:rhodanese-like domain-containing protein n=1 Tax=Hydrogenophaga sp. BPS33 TaxID=2651974 RepID=UPI001358593D|nr:rhodanese-like domain-containing protein [Hydrogenophaga sp. BPS33]
MKPFELKARLDQPAELALIDVSEEGEFGLGHLFRAVNVPYSRLELLIRPLVPRLSCPIVLVDHGNGIASLAAQRLRAMGYGAIEILDGGTAGWAHAGYQLFHGVYVPSKAFGEWVEHEFDTPSIDAHTLSALLEGNEDVVVLDPRTVAEHAVRHVPGAIACPGAELLYRFGDLVPSPQTLVVVACGGRTRGIMGAQSLITAGVPNRVVALADGNHGWTLAGLALEEGLQRAYGRASAQGASMARERADAVLRRYRIPVVDRDILAQWLRDNDSGERSTFAFDIRAHDEYQAAHLPGTRSAPGGQLIQATDQWVGTLGARIVLVDDDGVRAVLTAYWMGLMGWDVHVLRDHGTATGATHHDAASAAAGKSAAITADMAADMAARVVREARRAEVRAEEIEPSLAAQQLTRGALAVSVDSSADYLSRHPRGALWANRARLGPVVEAAKSTSALLLFSVDGESAHLAALDLQERLGASGPAVQVVRGGMEAWIEAGLPVDAAPEDRLAQADRIDTLYWAHDRRRGNLEAMRTYLEWEKHLLAQMAADGVQFTSSARDERPVTSAMTKD